MATSSSQPQTAPTDQERLAQQGTLRGFLAAPTGDRWLTIWASETRSDGVWFVCSCLAPLVEARHRVSDGSVGHLPHHFGPIAYTTAEGEPAYARYGDDEPLEPIVIEQAYHGVYPDTFELAEDFRLFYKLRFDHRDGIYRRMLENGDLDEAGRVVGHRVDVKYSYLHRYLQARQLALVVAERHREWSPESLSTLGLQSGQQGEKSLDLAWYLDLFDAEPLFGDAVGYSDFNGARLILPPPRDSSSAAEPPEHEPYIVGANADGSPHYANVAAGAEFLTPVHFRKEVLQRYRDDARFSVSDGYLSCGELWGLRMDNDHPSRVAVFLGDLGDLPPAERTHWHAHNTPPKGPLLSDTGRQRSFPSTIDEALVNPSGPEFVFRHQLHETNAAWEARFGWKVFKPLSEEDVHDLKRLRVPLNETMVEFENQVKALAKATVESIDSRLDSLYQQPRGVDAYRPMRKLQAALEALGADSQRVTSEYKEPFSLLHALNNGVRHRKSKDWERAKQELRIGERPNSEAFEDLLERVTRVLSFIQAVCDGAPDAMATAPSVR